MGDTSTLVWGMIFGSIGIGFFMYGKKQKRKVPYATGVALCVFPYFVSNIYALIFVGLILIAIPFVIEV